MKLRLASIPLIALFAACGPQQASTTKDAAPAALSSSFSSTCSTCHGAAAEGDYGPALAKTALTLDAFKATVRAGRGPMPAFPVANYSDADLAADYAFLTKAK